MSEVERLAAVIPIRRARASQPRVDVDAPFRRYREAGLVNARFGIEGVAPLFWGYHQPGRRWNGWATPGFRREVAELIVEWVNAAQPGAARWDGEVLYCSGGDGSYIDEVSPDDLGLYRFDGWTWLEGADGH